MVTRPLVLCTLALAVAAPAAAWEIEDPLHSNCHERLSVAALRAGGGYRGGTTPAAPTGDDATFFDNQQYDARQYDRNMAMLALITGVRSNDVRGLPDFDLPDLAAAANDDADQPAHCLRRLADDGADGDRAALKRCRDFITSEIDEAMMGVADDGTVDPAETEDVPVAIPYVGTVRWPLSKFYYHAGRALHALQDSFTHTYRDPSFFEVYAVANWMDPIRGDFDEARDGPPHETMLDQCETTRPWRQAQLDAVAQASQALYGVLATGSAVSVDARDVALTAVLDMWLTYHAGCDLTSGYCANAIHADLIANGLSDGGSAGGCALGGGAGAGGAGGLRGLFALVALGLIAGLAVVRRRRGALLLLALLLPAGARAEPEPRPGPEATSWRGVVRAGASLNTTAVAGGAGLVFTWRRLEVEGGLEWNPWTSIERGTWAAGALNLYLLAGYRWPVGPNVDITAGVGGGLAVSLFETVGTPAGNVGPFLTLRPLGVTRRLGGRFALTINAFELDVPVPQTRGWPYTVAQYRAAVGLRF
jgi:hypothetical protein